MHAPFRRILIAFSTREIKGNWMATIVPIKKLKVCKSFLKEAYRLTFNVRLFSIHGLKSIINNQLLIFTPQNARRISYGNKIICISFCTDRKQSLIQLTFLMVYSQTKMYSSIEIWLSIHNEMPTRWHSYGALPSPLLV